jgi:hypothetical protein
VQCHISRLLGIPRISLPFNYLVIPLSDSVARNISSDSLILSLSNRLSTWTFISLNLVARLILLKYVLQAIPAYLFSTLASPQMVIKSIRNIQRNFLWHGHDPGKKWALVSWEKVCNPKSLGGLGVWDPGRLNKIMGEKLWCRWLKYPTELWAKLWKKKYAPCITEAQLI